MGCSSCGSGGGTPRGCKNNGTCSSGGCSKLEVFDWLANMQLPQGQNPYDIVELRFKNSRKSFFRNHKNLSLQAGDVVVVEASPGYDIGVVSVTGELAKIQVSKKEPNLKALEIKRILRIANQEDLDKWVHARSLEKDVMYRSRTLALALNLQMKISDVEYQGDLSKAVFYYTAEGRVDFRQLIKDMADEFKIRVEMKQIGSRQEASRLGGIGSCGRELCCSTWLTDFRTVSTSAARYQQLSLNPQKLAGQCGKLKCCLNYELDMYLESIKSFPKADTKLRTQKGQAYHIKTDVFKRQMWYVYEGDAGQSSGLIPLAPERVKEIIRLNVNGEKPADLKDFVETVVVKEPDYTNVVGQDSLNRFEHAFKNKKKRKPNNNRGPRNNEEGAQAKVNNPNQNPNANKNRNLKPENSGPKPANVQNENPNQKVEGVEGINKNRNKKRNFRKKNPNRNPGDKTSNTNE